MIQILKNWLQKYFSDPQVVILGFLLLFGFLLIWKFGNMLAPVFASMVIAYLLDGMVCWLQRLKMPRLTSVAVVFVFFMACLFITFIGLFPMLSSQIGQLLSDLPSWLATAQSESMRLPEKYPEIISEEQIKLLTGQLNAELTRLGQYLLAFFPDFVRGSISILIYLILVPLMVFFFLKDKSMIIEWGKGFLPEERGLTTEVWNEVNQQVANYVRGKMWEICIVWFCSYITFKFLGLKFTMLISVFVGLSVIVPYLGATMMTIPVVLIAWFQWGWGPDFAYAVIAYGVIQALDGNLLVPLLLSGVVNLHPIAIIVAVLLFGGLWGIWGLFFAIPLATLVHSVIKAWFNKRAHVHREDESAAECIA